MECLNVLDHTLCPFLVSYHLYYDWIVYTLYGIVNVFVCSVCICTSGVRYQDFYFDMISYRYWGKYRNFDTIFDNF